MRRKPHVANLPHDTMNSFAFLPEVARAFFEFPMWLFYHMAHVANLPHGYCAFVALCYEVEATILMPSHVAKKPHKRSSLLLLSLSLRQLV